MEEFRAPTLVIAMPQLLDPNFHRSVVLLIEKNEEGAFGLVINRVGENRVAELCTNLSVTWGGNADAMALYGGPVASEQGFLLHGAVADDVTVESREIVSGIHIASDMETFRALCERPPADFRILLGYAGWGPGQLDNEILSGAWLTTDVTPDHREEIDQLLDRLLGCRVPERRELGAVLRNEGQGPIGVEVEDEDRLLAHDLSAARAPHRPRRLHAERGLEVTLR
jgi:putative transcriptional regulator